MRTIVESMLTSLLLISLTLTGCAANSNCNGNSNIEQESTSTSMDEPNDSESAVAVDESTDIDEKSNREAIITYMRQAFNMWDAFNLVMKDESVLDYVMDRDTESIASIKAEFDREHDKLKELDAPAECKALDEKYTEACFLMDKYLEKCEEASRTDDIKQATEMMSDAETYIRELTPYFESIATEILAIDKQYVADSE